MTTIKHIKLLTLDTISYRHPFVWWKPMRYISAAIRFFTKCKYNHSAIIIECWDKVMVAEAKSKGISITPYEDWAKDLKISIQRQKLVYSRKKLAQTAMSKQGYTGYDFSGTLFYQLIYQLTGHWLGAKDKKRAEKRMYCSEYVAWIWNEVINLYPDFYKIAPDDIHNDTNFSTIYIGKANKLKN